jgi:hypothetical protein
LKTRVHLFDKQVFHFLALLILLRGVLSLVDDPTRSGQLFGLTTYSWLLLSLLVPVLHQVYVWFIWRVELCSRFITRTFGKNGFTYYAIGFTILIISRPVIILVLAASNRNSLQLNPVLSAVLSAVFLLLSGYLFYSVKKFFGFKRAFGIDHFDPSYRHLPFVRKGIFRFTPNAMYTFGFLILWVPGLVFSSRAALLAALFNHLYIWVHYFCTEWPDMQYMYRNRSR